MMPLSAKDLAGLPSKKYDIGYTDNKPMFSFGDTPAQPILDPETGLVPCGGKSKLLGVKLMKLSGDKCPVCGEELEIEFDETSCCLFCPVCGYERIERE
jgi:hypothetical protein